MTFLNRLASVAALALTLGTVAQAADSRVNWMASLRVLRFFLETRVTLSVVTADSALYMDWLTR